MLNIDSELSNLIDPKKNDLLGIVGLTEDVIEIENRPAFIWVRLADDTSQAVQAYNRKVTPVFDLPVVLSFDGIKYEVQGIDSNRYSKWTNGGAYLPNHGMQHSAMYGASGNDIVWVDQQQFLPLLPTPGGSLTGTNQIYVAPYVFKNSKGNWIYAGNTGVVIPPATISTGSNMYLLYMRDLDGLLYTKQGSPFAASITGTAGFMPYLPGGLTNNNDIPIVAVRRNGLTSGAPITWNDVLDVRQFYRGLLPSATGTIGYMETLKIYVSGTLIGEANELDLYGRATGQMVGDRAKVFLKDQTPLITGDPTGFTDPENIVVTYNSSTRKITLTGTVKAYWKGDVVSVLVSGWESSAHPDVSGDYFLYYDGSSFTWSTSSWTFEKLQIAFVNYDPINKYAIREPHGLMPWQAHEEFHRNIGTYKESGGDLSNYVLSSTTAANRRPFISPTSVHDEDIHTTLSLSTGTYTRFSLGTSGTSVFNLDSADIINLSGTRPYYNSYSAPNWSQTLLGVGEYTTIWLMGMPTSADTVSQKYRYFWIQGQSVGTLTEQQNVETDDLNLGDLEHIATESLFLAKLIIRYIGGNWTIEQVDTLSGNHFSQVGHPSGNFLSAVSTDATLTGDGTAGNPLSVVGGPGGGSIGVIEADGIPSGTPINTLVFGNGSLGITGTNAYITFVGSGTGDVVGPASAIDGHLVVFDGTSGKLIKDGGVSGGMIEIGIDGGGTVPTTGILLDLIIPYNITITGWKLLGNISGSIQLDLWKAAFASFPPTVANTVTASEKPTLSSSLTNSGSCVGWTADWDANDTVRVNIDSATTLGKATLALSYIRR